MRLFVSQIGMNRVQGTRESVEAVLASTEKFYLSLTNQNSTDGTKEYFDEVKKRYPDRVFVFHEDTNTFFQPPNNRAYHMACKLGCEYFLCLNDDAIIPKYGLAKMMQVLDLNPSVAVVGAKGGCEELSPGFHGQPGKLEFVEGSCMMVRISALRKHRQTLFWEELRGIYSEDSELSLFLQEKGYQIAKAEFDLPHARSQTVNRDFATQAACKAFQDRNHQLCVHRYEHWLKCRRFDYPIIIKRRMALGDVILSTALTRAIKECNPLSDIYVETDFPEVFQNNPSVLEANKEVPNLPDALIIDLNGCYENTPMKHVLEVYESVAKEKVRGLGTVEWRTEMFPGKKEIQWAQAMRSKIGGDKLCLIHGDQSHWNGKNVDSRVFDEVSGQLRRNGWKVAVVGSGRRAFGFGNDIDLSGQTSILQLAALCRTSDLFVGADSGPIHVAQSVGCPVVGLFGVTSSRFLLTHGSKFWACEADPNIESAGLRHRVAGKTFLNEGKEAIESISPAQVIHGIQQLISA